MPTTDERREVAARLREISTPYYAGFNPMSLLKKTLFGDYPPYLRYSHSDAFAKLADLIEPEPERTCRVERMEIDEFGRYFYLSCGHMQMTHNNSALPYCPNCGARVKEGE